MTSSVRWVVLAVVAVLVVSLLIWARGTTHHRGTEVGALPAVPAASRTVPGG